MDLKEAYKQAKNGDWLADDGKKAFAKGATCLGYIFTVANGISDKWEVIPAKKKPVPANVLLDRARSRTNTAEWATDDVEWAINASAENTHLIYADLIVSVTKFFSDDNSNGCDDVLFELAKIRAIDQPLEIG